MSIHFTEQHYSFSLLPYTWKIIKNILMGLSLIMNAYIYIKLANSSPNTLYTKLNLSFVKESLKS